MQIEKISAAKFTDPDITAKGERRASVGLDALTTLWVNTGTLCNLSCEKCYIESTPKNDRLAYFSRDELRRFLDEISRESLPVREIGFTGGEPFLNKDMVGMIEDSLAAGFDVLVLTNAMTPMAHAKAALLDLNRRYPKRLTMRVSFDHYAAPQHDSLRGKGAFASALDGLTWLARNDFFVSVAGRTCWDEDEPALRQGFARLFHVHDIQVPTEDHGRLVLFPEMDEQFDVPEITEACWGILGKSPADVMCSSSRMVVKRRGAPNPVVLACTLIAYDEAFEMGATLSEASVPVKLNHPHCAKFCVLGGASCST